MAARKPMPPLAWFRKEIPAQFQGFLHGGKRNSPGKVLREVFRRFPQGQVFKQLPNHDACPFEGRLAVAYQRIGHDVSSQLRAGGGADGLEPTFRGKCACFHCCLLCATTGLRCQLAKPFDNRAACSTLSAR